MTSPVPPLQKTSPALLTPTRLGATALPNRVVMAPMTRSRAEADGNPTELMESYYEQRAGAGLIITEGVIVSPQGRGYPNTPGIFTDEQAARWARIVAAVHRADGRIFAQLWHVGRTSHPSLQPDGALPVSASAIAPEGQFYSADGMMPYVTPRALETEEVRGVVDDFRRAAELARRAGFDGVEIHGANGYLIDQFLRDGTNHRTDRYGGPVQNRTRFMLEVVEAVCGVFGADRVGVRLSPLYALQGMRDSAPQATFVHAAAALRAFGLAYLHVVELGSGPFDWQALRTAFGGRYVANGGYDRERAEAVIDAGQADLVAFGTPFIANPDLVERFRLGAELQPSDRGTYYAGGSRGYTDYPTLLAAG